MINILLENLSYCIYANKGFEQRFSKSNMRIEKYL